MRIVQCVFLVMFLMLGCNQDNQMETQTGRQPTNVSASSAGIPASPDGAESNTLRLTTKPSQTFQIILNPGWNLVSFPCNPMSNAAFKKLFGAYNTPPVEQIWEWTKYLGWTYVTLNSVFKPLTPYWIVVPKTFGQNVQIDFTCSPLVEDFVYVPTRGSFIAVGEALDLAATEYASSLSVWEWTKIGWNKVDLNTKKLEPKKAYQISHPTKSNYLLPNPCKQ